MLGNPAIPRPRQPLGAMDARGVVRSFAPDGSAPPAPAPGTLSPEAGKVIGDSIAGIIKGIGDAIGGGKPAPAPPPPPPSLIPGIPDKHLAIGAAAAVLLAVVAWKLS